jgi:hypothetical protein
VIQRDNAAKDAALVPRDNVKDSIGGAPADSSAGATDIRAGAVPIESVELSRAGLYGY